MPTLSQRLGSFPSESRAEIWPRCRRDYPLPPPINRGWVYGLIEEKIWSKISQKTSHFPCSCNFSLSSPSLSTMVFSHHHSHHQSSHHQLHHRKPTQPPTDHQEPPSVSLSSLQPLSFSSSSFASSATTGFTTVISINPAPHQWKSSDRDLLSLLLPAFLSPLQLFFFFLPQPTLATITSVDASWATGRTTSSRPRPPRQATSFCLLCLFLPRRSRCMQQLIN